MIHTGGTCPANRMPCITGEQVPPNMWTENDPKTRILINTYLFRPFHLLSLFRITLPARFWADLGKRKKIIFTFSWNKVLKYVRREKKNWHQILFFIFFWPPSSGFVNHRIYWVLPNQLSYRIKVVKLFRSFSPPSYDRNYHRGKLWWFWKALNMFFFFVLFFFFYLPAW